MNKSWTGRWITTLGLMLALGTSVASQTPNYGQIQIGAFPSATPASTSNVSMSAQVGDTITLIASITGGTSPLSGVPIFLSTTDGSFVGNQQCNVDSAMDAAHYCLYQLKLPAKPKTITVTASAVGATAGDFTNTPTVTITTQKEAVPGTIVLQSAENSNGNIPNGMSSPFWAVLQDSSGVGDTRVTVTQPSNITINPGIASNPLSCTLSSSSPVCGFGALASATGSATISATVAGYTISDLDLTVTAPDTTTRTITFTNTSTSPVWVGITGGTANGYLTGDMIASGDTTCGPSNPQAACPTGSTCRQGGANPGKKTAYFCYWDQPTPSNGYEIATAAGKHASTSVSISTSSYDPMADVIWSGNAYPRQGCTVGDNGQLICDIADCGNAHSGSACAPGTGGSPAVATLAEFTLQKKSTDYYDISIIGGANVITTMGPATGAPTANGYSCGIAGSTSAQGTLKAADWDMVTHVGDTFAQKKGAYSTSSQTGTKSTAYYHYIASPAAGRTGEHCASGQASCDGDMICGYDDKAVNNGKTSDYVSSCGTHLAWLSANAIAALNTASTNAAPFPFSSDASLFLCNGANAYSGYSSKSSASEACGCTNWGDSSYSIGGDYAFPSQVATPSQGCAVNNKSGGSYQWIASVLPTIAWLKRSCPTCYTYPFDDMSSTFQCKSSSGDNTVKYDVTFKGNIAGEVKKK